jgi:hypothetical protein
MNDDWLEDDASVDETDYSSSSPWPRVVIAALVLCVIAVAVVVVLRVRSGDLAVTVTPIGRILDHPRNYDGRTVKIRGTASKVTGLFGSGGFELRDRTGSIMVITGRGLPAEGEEVSVRGEVRTIFAVGNERVLAVVEQGAGGK